jgi:hypothetical protein
MYSTSSPSSNPRGPTEAPGLLDSPFLTLKPEPLRKGVILVTISSNLDKQASNLLDSYMSLHSWGLHSKSRDGQYMWAGAKTHRPPTLIRFFLSKLAKNQQMRSKDSLAASMHYQLKYLDLVHKQAPIVE